MTETAHPTRSPEALEALEAQAAEGWLNEARVEALQKRLAHLQSDHAAREAVLARALADSLAQTSALEAELAQIYASRSWQGMQALRRVLPRGFLRR